MLSKEQEIELLKSQVEHIDEEIDRLEDERGEIEYRLFELTGCDCAALGLKCFGHG